MRNLKSWLCLLCPGLILAFFHNIPLLVLLHIGWISVTLPITNNSIGRADTFYLSPHSTGLKHLGSRHSFFFR